MESDWGVEWGRPMNPASLARMNDGWMFRWYGLAIGQVFIGVMVRVRKEAASERPN